MIAVLMTTGLFVVAVNAQDAPPPPRPGNPPAMSKEDHEKMKQKRDEEQEKALKTIGASDDQIKKAKDVFEEFGKKQRDLRKDATLSEEDRKSKGKELRDQQEVKLKEILGDEKLSKFKESRKQQRKDGPPPPPPAHEK